MSDPVLLTDELRARIGQTASYTAPEPLGRAAIRYFAAAVGDANPLYTDPAYAREHGYDDVIAPPTLLAETNQYVTGAPDADGYLGHSWHLEVPGTPTGAWWQQLSVRQGCRPGRPSSPHVADHRHDRAAHLRRCRRC